jgi:hypothetical protein
MIASVDRFVSPDLPARVQRPLAADDAPSPCIRNAAMASAVLWGLIGVALALIV